MNRMVTTLPTFRAGMPTANLAPQTGDAGAVFGCVHSGLGWTALVSGLGFAVVPNICLTYVVQKILVLFH